MKNLKILIYLNLFLSFVFTQQLIAQNVMTTLFEDFAPIEQELGLPAGVERQDQAWAGAETSDGGLLVVGVAEESGVEKRAFISRYTFTTSIPPTDSGNDYEAHTRQTQFVDDWSQILDIKSIRGGNQYVIVGVRGTDTNNGPLSAIGIAVITDLTATSPVPLASGDPIFEINEFNVGVWDKSVDILESLKKANINLNVLEDAIGSAIVRHKGGDKFDPDVFTVVLADYPTATIYLLQFEYRTHYLNSPSPSSSGFTLVGISEEYEGLRLPHAIAACDDYLVVAGQGLNRPLYYDTLTMQGDSTLNDPLVITSWSKDDLSLIGDWVGSNASNHKPKMVACAGPNLQGVLASGGFYYNNSSATKSLAYFPDPSILNQYVFTDDSIGNDILPPVPEYFNQEIMDFNAAGFPDNPSWPAIPVSYAQAIARLSTGEYILAGQSGPSSGSAEDESMVAMIVNPVSLDNSIADFSVTHFTEVFNGDDDENSNSPVDFCFANYVIQLSTAAGEPRKYALFGLADWIGGTNNGNTYVVIVSE